MSQFFIQDLGDGEGLDVLDENHDGVEFGRTEQEVSDWAVGLDPDDVITVMAGALGRETDEDGLSPSDVLNELG